MNLADLETLTEQFSPGWGMPHARRVLRLASEIGAGMDYDPQALEIAATLHDWGAYPPYQQTGVEHALRSRQVAESEILPQMAVGPAQAAIILEAIELHDYRDARTPTSTEAVLLREADMLDFIGVIGLTRAFAAGPKNLQACLRVVFTRRDGVVGRFTLPRAQQIARIRLERLGQCLEWLQEESFGLL